MRSIQACWYGTAALSAAIGISAAACGGGAPSSEDLGAGASGAQAERPLESSGDVRGEVGHRVSALAKSRAKAKGSGFAEFSVCATGASCAGARAGTEFYAQVSPESADAGAACTSTMSGACVVETCPSGGGAAPGINAGTLTIGGGSIGSVAVTATKAEEFTYFWDQAGAAFTGGDTLTLSGSGAKVPAFATESLVAPAQITLSEPTAGKTGRYAISTSAPLHVAWSGGTAGAEVFLQGQASSPITEDGGTVVLAETYVSCAWDSAANKGTVPASVLAALAGLKGSLVWGQEAFKAFHAGAYDIDDVIDTVGEAPATFE